MYSQQDRTQLLLVSSPTGTYSIHYTRFSTEQTGRSERSRVPFLACPHLNEQPTTEPVFTCIDADFRVVKSLIYGLPVPTDRHDFACIETTAFVDEPG
jgi:hypothetical protein